MTRLFLLIFTLFFVTHCSVKENFGIWNKKDENLENQKKVKKLFSDDKKIITEFNSGLNSVIIFLSSEKSFFTFF